MIRQTKQIRQYEPPAMKVYRFTEQDKVLTASGSIVPTEPSTDPTQPTPSSAADYAANALNQFMGGSNTTFEK